MQHETQVTPATRGTVHGDAGAVATSHPLAARAAIDVLNDGGSAADAAVCAAAVLNVVDPRSTGIGGDAFALCWFGNVSAPTALAGAGVSSSGLSVESLRAARLETMPVHGPWTVTVPGAVSTWDALLTRYGKLGLERVLAPAIRIAEEGFEITPIVAADWARSRSRLAADAEAIATFLPGGAAPAVGERFANPALARSLRRLVTAGPRDLYEGKLAAAIAGAVQAAGGPLTTVDLADWGGAEWVEPIHRRFVDIDVYQLPPPGQGIVLLEALGLYEAVDARTPADEEHVAAEALKLAFCDAFAFLADPAAVAVPTQRLLSDSYLARRSHTIDVLRAGDPGPGPASETVYVAVADADGGACSFIQSLYHGFGSGICVPGTGILLQNRGAGFVADDAHPNRAAPRKRPFHTIMPTLLGRREEFLGCLGVVGGYMQPQGQMQILRALFERGIEPQEAVEAPRMRVSDGRRLDLEAGYDEALADELAARGHVVSTLEGFDAGGAQLVLLTDSGYAGASDPRKDGCAIGR